MSPFPADIQPPAPAAGRSVDGAHRTHDARRMARRALRLVTGRARRGDTGQAALVMVIAITVLLTTVGGTMVSTIINNDPILSQTAIQRYAYRALASGLNAYQSAINADPYLAACNSTTNYSTTPQGANANSQCAGLNYQTWSQVPGTGVGNGIIPEYYKFDNPQQVVNSTTDALSYLDVQIVGAAGFGTHLVYYSTVAKFTPANGFLNNVWWSNYEATGTAANCQWYWNTNYQNDGSCTPVYFGPNDSITGPVFSNDSIFVDGSPSFGANYAVTTADPNCLFVDPLDGNRGSPPGCSGANADVGSYDASTSSYGKDNLEPIPTDNTKLANFALQDGCYYMGPTTITLNGNQMTVVSAGTAANASGDSTHAYASNTSTCPVDGTASLPANGVIFVENGNDSGYTGQNPFDGVAGQYVCGYGRNGSPTYCTGTIDNQTLAGSSPSDPACGCYYGATSTPNVEGDAFVSGSLSGHLTIGADNDVIIDGPLTYADCSWVGTSSQSNCNYNSATSATSVNDTLGLIAYNYVEVNHPEDSSGNILPQCGTNGAEPAPLCDPSVSGGNPAGGQGLVIDASILALQQSYIVNNYDQGSPEGTLTVYGSIQQDARGAVGTFSGNNIVTGYAKHYLWDPRLPLYSPPYYLTPGTPSWALVSSSESYTGTCPTLPPAQSTPSSTQPTFNQSSWATCNAAP